MNDPWSNPGADPWSAGATSSAAGSIAAPSRPAVNVAIGENPWQSWSDPHAGNQANPWQSWEQGGAHGSFASNDYGKGGKDKSKSKGKSKGKEKRKGGGKASQALQKTIQTNWFAETPAEHERETFAASSEPAPTSSVRGKRPVPAWQAEMAASADQPSAAPSAGRGRLVTQPAWKTRAAESQTAPPPGIPSESVPESNPRHPSHELGSGLECKSRCNFYAGGGAWLSCHNGEYLQLLFRRDSLAYCRAHCRYDAPAGWVPLQYLSSVPRYEYSLEMDITTTPNGLGLDRAVLDCGILVLRVVSHSCGDAYNKRVDEDNYRDRLVTGDIIFWIHDGIVAYDTPEQISAALNKFDTMAQRPKAHGSLKMHVFRLNSEHDGLVPCLQSDAEWNGESEVIAATLGGEEMPVQDAELQESIAHIFDSMAVYGEFIADDGNSEQKCNAYSDLPHNATQTTSDDYQLSELPDTSDMAQSSHSVTTDGNSGLDDAHGGLWNPQDDVSHERLAEIVAHQQITPRLVPPEIAEDENEDESEDQSHLTRFC